MLLVCLFSGSLIPIIFFPQCVDYRLTSMPSHFRLLVTIIVIAISAIAAMVIVIVAILVVIVVAAVAVVIVIVAAQ